MILPLMAGLLIGTSSAQTTSKVPKVFSAFLKADKNYNAEVVRPFLPEEIDTYLAKIKEAAKKDPEWFKEYSEKSKPGIPMPFDEKLGLTEKEYKEYRALWDKRELKPLQKVGLRLVEDKGKWKIISSGASSLLSLLQYDPKEDVVISANGKLARIDDIDASAETILGAWKGHEWKFEEKTTLGRTKENFAIGRAITKKPEDGYGILVYRLQESASTGQVVLDQSFVIKFALDPK